MMNGFFDKEYFKDVHETLLHLVQHGQDTMVNNLLTKMKEAGTPCDLTITNSGGESLVGIAAEYNMLSMVKVLLRHGAPHDQPNLTSGLIPKISAQVNKNEEIIRILENPAAFLSEEPQVGSRPRVG